MKFVRSELHAHKPKARNNKWERRARMLRQRGQLVTTQVVHTGNGMPALVKLNIFEKD